MTAPNKKLFTVGLNAARIYQLDQDDGTIASTNATAYDGLAVGGPVAFSYEYPDPESIAHPGNNYVLQRDTLPSLDSSSGTMEVSRSDMDTIAAIANMTARSYMTDVNSIVWNTNKQGNEPTVALLVYAQAKTDTGTRAWSTYVFPKCVIVPKAKGMAREQANISYFVQPQSTTKHLTGDALTVNSDGATSAELIEYQSNYRMHYAAWTVSSTETELVFDTNIKYTANGAAGIKVTKNGTLLTYAATASTADEYYAAADKITFGLALTNGDKVVAFYEIADTGVDVE